MNEDCQGQEPPASPGEGPEAQEPLSSEGLWLLVSGSNSCSMPGGPWPEAGGHPGHPHSLLLPAWGEVGLGSSIQLVGREGQGSEEPRSGYCTVRVGGPDGGGASKAAAATGPHQGPAQGWSPRAVPLHRPGSRGTGAALKLLCPGLRSAWLAMYKYS